MVAEKSDERELLFSKIVPRGKRVVMTVEEEGGERKRKVVKVWQERSTEASNVAEV